MEKKKDAGVAATGRQGEERAATRGKRSARSAFTETEAHQPSIGGEREPDDILDGRKRFSTTKRNAGISLFI